MGDILNKLKYLDMSNNYYRQYDEDVVAYMFVRYIVLDPHNIKQHFHNKWINSKDNFTHIAKFYKFMLFNKKPRDIHKQFKTMINDCDFNYEHIMFRIITPACFKRVQDYNSPDDLIEWIVYHEDENIFKLYCLSIVDDIIKNHNDYIQDIINDTTPKAIAISKLKRNRIVNEGILLKLSMRDCGMF